MPPLLRRGTAIGAVLAALVVAAPVAGAPPQVDYSPPVDAPISDPYRPPPGPYAPGNRGIDFATEPGTAVRAAGAGRVRFAGPVGGTLHVTIAHADGVRTSYSFLASVAVRRDEAVGRGVTIGHTGSRLHVGARRGDAYFDPATLWAPGRLWVRLVPLDGGEAPTSTPGPRRATGSAAAGGSSRLRALLRGAW